MNGDLGRWGEATPLQFWGRVFSAGQTSALTLVCLGREKGPVWLESSEGAR